MSELERSSTIVTADVAPLRQTHEGWHASAGLPSLPEAFRSVPVYSGASVWRKLLAFAGPGYLVAVGYMDPGNWATDLGGGSRASRENLIIRAETQSGGSGIFRPYYY